MIATPEMTATAKPATARKRTAVKASGRQETAKTKLTLYVTVETAQRLAVHATMTHTDRSAVVESLIRDNCRRFVVQDRARTGDHPSQDTSAA